MIINNLFNAENSIQNKQTFLSIRSNSFIEVRFNSDQSRMECDLTCFKHDTLIAIADVLSALTNSLQESGENIVIPKQGYHVMCSSLRPIVDLDYLRTEQLLEGDSIKFHEDVIDLFFMKTLNPSQGSEHEKLWDKLTPRQQEIINNHVEEFLANYHSKPITTPMAIVGFPMDKTIQGTFLPKTINEDFDKKPYYIQAFFNGFLTSEQKLNLIRSNGSKFTVCFDNNKQYDEVSTLGRFRNVLLSFRVHDLPNLKKGKTTKLESVEGPVNCHEGILLFPGT